MSGNGTDQGHIVAMLQQVMASLAEQGRVLHDQGRVLQEHSRALQEQGRKLDGLAEDVSSLRQTVTHYHGSVLGHAFLITELEQRVRRIENHLELPPSAPAS